MSYHIVSHHIIISYHIVPYHIVCRKRQDTYTGAVCCLSDKASSTFADNRPLLAAENMKTSASYTYALEKIFPLAGINRFISLIPCPHPGPLLVLLIVRPSRGQ